MADLRRRLVRALTLLTWAVAAYALALVSGFYFGFFTVRRHHIESASFLLIAFLLGSVLSRPTDIEHVRERYGRALSTPAMVTLFLLFAALLYFPVVGAGLFADDFVLLEAARQGRLTVWNELFRPALFVVWRAVAIVTESPAPWLHLLNVVLHGFNAAMVWALTSRLGLPHWSFIAALLFLFYPAAVEAVAWPAGIQDVLMTTFILAFLLVTVSGKRNGRTLILAALFVIAALLTKETAVCGPIVAALLSLPERRWRTAWPVLALSAAVVAAFLVSRMMLLPLPQTYRSLPDRYAMKELLVRPFQTLIVPLRDVEVQMLPFIALALVAVVVIALTTAASNWTRTNAAFHTALAAAGVVLFAVAPVYSYFFITGDLQGSRYLYLASAGWVVLVVTVLDASTTRHRAAAKAAAVFLLISWVVAARAHIALWNNAGDIRDRILRAAEAQMKIAPCAQWAIYGVAEQISGVPTFVNGFPEAMRSRVAARIRIAPNPGEPGECRLTWTGTAFKSD